MRWEGPELNVAALSCRMGFQNERKEEKLVFTSIHLSAS